MFHRKPDPKLEILRSIPLFDGCGTAELADIARLADEIDVPAGAILTRQGRPGRECFVVVDGEASVIVDRHVIARVGPGTILGEMALLDRQPRSATVRAETPMRLLVFSPGAFGGALDEHPTFARHVMVTVSERLRAFEADLEPETVGA